MRPMLKNAAWQRVGADLHIVADSVHIVLADTSGDVGRLLELLRAGTRDSAELARALTAHSPSVQVTDVDDAVHALNELGLVVDADATGEEVLTARQRERFETNLGFFTPFASLNRSAESFQRAALDAHVVFLGTGGLGCAVIPALAGLGVNRMTLLDCDVVELKNFNRQYLYRETDIGRLKVERAAAWVRGFNSSTDVRAVDLEVCRMEDVAGLLPGADLLISGIDSPDDVDLLVNQACLPAGIPFIHGGLLAQEISYGSVDPGRSACLACAGDSRGDGDPLIATLAAGLDPLNRTSGPVMSMLGGLVAMEALRYLTRFTEPIAAGCDRIIDFTTGAERVRRWDRRPDCPVCASGPAAGATPGHQAVAAGASPS
jgi:molybdopterin-synthase adenylyltransferase